MRNNPNLDLVKINVNTKSGIILPLCSKDIEHNQNSEQNSDINIGHNSVIIKRKMMRNNPTLNLVNINAYTKFSNFLSN